MNSLKELILDVYLKSTDHLYVYAPQEKKIQQTLQVYFPCSSQY